MVEFRHIWKLGWCVAISGTQAPQPNIRFLFACSNDINNNTLFVNASECNCNFQSRYLGYKWWLWNGVTFKNMDTTDISVEQIVLWITETNTVTVDAIFNIIPNQV